MSFLRLDRLCKHYGSSPPVLSDVSLDIQQGEFVAVVGASGCGKSTLLRQVAGLATASSGHIHWEQPLGRGDLGMVFQDATLMPWATVLANVRLPLDVRGLPRTSADKRCLDALDDVGLTEKSTLYPHLLSGGMKMRVALARALATDPKVLLLDEPFAALDEITREKLNADLSTLWARNRITALFVTHSIYEAIFLATRVVVMAANPGRIYADVAVDLPFPRHHDLRLSNEYLAICRTVSDLLAKAMGQEILHREAE